MGLIGHSMSHAKWGIGIVEREENNILYVRFRNTAEGEVLKPFIYPDALVKGHLIAADADAQTAIKKLRMNIDAQDVANRISEPSKLMVKECVPPAVAN